MKINIDFKNKGLIIGIVALLILITVILVIVFNVDDNPDIGPAIKQPTVVNITESANKQIKYTQYNNGDFSMKIPEGWMVETVQGTNYAIRVYNPENEMSNIFLLYIRGIFKEQRSKTIL